MFKQKQRKRAIGYYQQYRYIIIVQFSKFNVLAKAMREGYRVYQQYRYIVIIVQFSKKSSSESQKRELSGRSTILIYHDNVIVDIDKRKLEMIPALFLSYYVSEFLLFL